MKLLTFLLLFFLGVVFCPLVYGQPVFNWARQMGGGTADGKSLAYDPQGNLYVAAMFYDTVDVDPGPAVTLMISRGSSDIYISKLTANGNLVWSQHIGGPGSDWCESVAVDQAGNVVTAGGFSDSMDIDPGTSVKMLRVDSLTDAFVCKFDKTGGFLWGHSLGCTISSNDVKAVFDQVNNIVVTGCFFEVADFDPGPATFTLSAQGQWNDLFVCKLDQNGSFIWAKVFGGPNIEYINSVVIDQNNNICFGGWFFSGGDFDPGPGTYSLSGNGTIEAYVEKLDANGNFIWAKSFGGPGMEELCGVAVDAAGNVYSAGSFNNVTDFDPGPSVYTLSALYPGADPSEYNIFVCKLSTNGSFLWAQQFGNSGLDNAGTVATDQTGNVYFAGYCTLLTDFDPGPAIYTVSNTYGNGFFCELNPAGNFICAGAVNEIGGGSPNGISNLVVNNAGEIVVTGVFSRILDMDPGPGTYTLDGSGGHLFISKYNACGNLVSLPENNVRSAVIFPNPSANGKFTIETSNVRHYTIYTAEGKQLLTKRDHSGKDLDLSYLPNGMYFVVLNCDDRSEICKIVIE
jgi:hypothetical protein